MTESSRFYGNLRVKLLQHLKCIKINSTCCSPVVVEPWGPGVVECGHQAEASSGTVAAATAAGAAPS